MPQLSIDFVANVARLQQDMNRAVRTVDKGFGDMRRAGQQVRNLFGMLGVSLGVYQIGSFIKQQIDAADALRDLHLQTGIAVGTLAGLDLVARKSGASLEDFAKANLRLSKYVTEGQQGLRENQKLIALLGITASDPTERLYQMADALKRIEDPSLRLATAQQVMGKSAGKLVPALMQGGDALRRQVEEARALTGVTEENVAVADKFNDDLEDMKTRMGGVALVIGASLVPALGRLAGEFTEGMKLAGGFWNALFTLGLINPFKDVSENLESIRLTFEAAERGEIELTEARRKQLQIQKEYLQYVQREKVLRDTAGADYGREGRDQGLTPGGKKKNINVALCADLGGVWDGKKCELEAGKFVERINKQIAGIYGDTYAALREEAKAQGFLDLVEGDIRRAEAADQAAKAAKQRNIEAGEMVDADIANKQSVDEFIKSTRLSNEEIRFQTSLYGHNTLEKEKAIAVRRIELDLAERIGRLDQNTPSYKSDVTALEENAEAAKRISKEVLDSQHEVSRSFSTGVADGMNQVISDATNSARQMQDLFIRAFSNMEDHLVQFVRTGKLGFKDFANSILEDMLRIAIQQQITAPMAGFFGGLFGGARASGGPVSSDAAYLVGERGPELFVPDTAGNIVPNGAGGANVQVNVINQTGQPASAKASQPRFDGEKYIVDVIMRNLDSNGPLRGAIAGAR